MTLAEQALNGLPLAVPVWDAHNHLGRWSAFHIPQDGRAEQMVACMDRLGIDKAFLTAHASIGPDFAYGNDQVLAAARAYPDRFLCYVTVNPNYPDAMAGELARCFSHPEFRGIKTHPSCHDSAINDRAYWPAYEEAERRGCPVLMHVWGSEAIAMVDEVAGLFPHAKFIMGHNGGKPKAMAKGLALLNRRANVYADLAVSTSLEGNVEWYCREADHHQILFGTDMPFLAPAGTLTRVALADISEEAKRDILAGNLMRLLGEA